jgi:hypothetical protein
LTKNNQEGHNNNFSSPAPTINLTPDQIGGFNCFGESRCVSGWNHAISQVQTDWNSGQYTQIQNGGNPDCFTGHTQAYCNGYTKGYTYEWNTLYQRQSSQPKPTSPSLPHFEFCNKGSCTSMGNGTCTVIANRSCVPTSASNMTGNYTDKGIALYNLGNYTGAISYHDKAVAALLQHLLGEICNKGLLHANRLLHANPAVGTISQNGTCSCSVRNETGLHCVPCSGLPESGGPCSGLPGGAYIRCCMDIGGCSTGDEG